MHRVRRKTARFCALNQKVEYGTETVLYNDCLKTSYTVNTVDLV